MHIVLFFLFCCIYLLHIVGYLQHLTRNRALVWTVINPLRDLQFLDAYLL